jgi:predicted phosphoribosyltransferase
MIFRNRVDAGIRLAKRLLEYKDQDCVVFALPRGGVVVGYEVAEAIKAPLELVIVRKVGHPNNPEFAVCAVTEDGERVCDENEVNSLDPIWLDKEIEKEESEAKRRHKKYVDDKQQSTASGKNAIIVDDGIATGLTIRVAIEQVKKMKPKKIIVAIPVAPSDVIDELNNLVDQVIVLDPGKQFFGSVGAYYENFNQVTDEEVIWLLDSLNLYQKRFGNP